MGPSMLYRRAAEPWPRSLLRRTDEFGIEEVDLARPPSRFWPGEAPELVRQTEDAARVETVPSPAALLSASIGGESTLGATRRSLARLQAWFLVIEDRQRRLDRQEVVALAHQASLVRHCLDEPSLKRVLIADEVGLGKTIEAGLILKEILANNPGLRVLYLAPARLVRNVHREFQRLGLSFRTWVADKEHNNATLDDDRIIASIHRAAHENHRERFILGARWDVIVVDECHHLSDWQEGGGAPVQKYRLVDRLVERLGDGRLILLSGTPHQGHPARFENLLRLLARPGEKEDNLAGRVIYRTKNDVVDWDGRPLFPGRQVNRPIEVELSSEYRRWLTDIHRFFEPEQRGDSRAAGWRAGMALQWATSSVHAGLGFLLRQGIRSGMTAKSAGIRAALEALRPYRGGPSDESIESIFARMRKEVERQQRADDVEDIEEDPGRWMPNPQVLEGLLQAGVALARNEGAKKWISLRKKILDQAPFDKFVLFAQPIETVTALSSFLEETYGVRPSQIIGNQSESDREGEIERFRTDPSVRFLVSSRAGGEGLNLQVARRLVHVDVPWNPMELEQRVGRVHRFGSRRTIVVETLVVAGSRETHAYSIAHAKLREIASALVAPERFEELFARVMSLVPPEELLDVLAQGPLAPLTDANARSVSDLVTEGFRRWQSFDETYKEQRRKIRLLDPGAASWPDLVDFLIRNSGAKPHSGFQTMRFRVEGQEVVEDACDAFVLKMDGELIAVGETDGMPVTNQDGRSAVPVGLNSAVVCDALQRAGLTEAPAGAAVVGLDVESRRRLAPLELPERFGVLAMAVQPIGSSRGYSELGNASLHLFVVVPGQEPRRLDGSDGGRLIRALVAGTARRELKSADLELVRSLREQEVNLWQELRRREPPKEGDRVLHAVTPIIAVVVS